MSLHALLVCRLQSTSSSYLLIIPALRALRCVTPSEVLFFEPFEKSLKLGDLMFDILDGRWDHTKEHGLSQLILIEEDLLKGVDQAVLKRLLFEHVWLDFYCCGPLDLPFIAFGQNVFQVRVDRVHAVDLVLENTSS